MSLNNQFLVKNDFNTYGQILSSGVNINNYLSPISLLTYVQQNSATWSSGGTANTIVQSNSGNWNTAYNIATAYSSVSSTFATNSTVSSLSGQFVLTTTLNTLTATTFNVNNLSATGAIAASAITISNSVVPLGNATPLTIIAGASGSVYNQIQNTYAGVSASTDLVVTNDGGIVYLDIGINSSKYNGTTYSPAFTIAGANDSYFYASSANLVYGTAGTTGDLVFFTGGSLSGTSVNSGNERLRIVNTNASNGGFVGINTSVPNQQLTVGGSISATSTVYAPTVNATTGYLYNGSGGSSGQVLRSNGTNYVGATLNASDIVSGQALTAGSDTNVVLTAGGSASSALLAAASITASWNGQLGVSRGGTGTSNGSITGTGALTFAAGSGNVNLVPASGGSTTIANISASGTGTIDGATIGSFTPKPATFTNLSQSNGTLSLSPNSIGTIDNVNIGQSNAKLGTFTNLVATSAISTTGNLYVNGSLYLGGSAIQTVQNDLVINDPQILLAYNNPANGLDIGVVGSTSYNSNYTGLIRDHTNNNWYLFDSMTVAPSANTFSNNTKTITTLVANTSGSHTGNATTATTLQNAQNFSLGPGDVTSPTVSFNGSSPVALATTIASNAVTYAKFQQVGANKILGNPTGSTANVSEISANTVGYQVLSAATPAAVANAAGLGTTNDVTFNSLTVNNLTTNTLTQNYYATNTNGAVLVNLFPYANYNYAKLLVCILASGRRASYEILATSDQNGTGSWTGTVYGIVDPGNILSTGTASIGNLGTSGSSLTVSASLSSGSVAWSSTVLAQAISGP